MAETWPSLVAYLEDTGLPHRITSTVRTGSTGSYHAVGQAIDAAEPWPSRDTPGLVAIQHSWIPIYGQLAELIGPDPNLCVKDGKPFWYDAVTMADHHDHVHVASTVQVANPEPATPERKADAVLAVALLTHPTWDGYVEVQEDGGVLAFDAPFHGSVPSLGIELHGMGRIIDAAVTGTGAGYWLMSGDGNIYSFGDAVYHGGRP